MKTTLYQIGPSTRIIYYAEKSTMVERNIITLLPIDSRPLAVSYRRPLSTALLHDESFHNFMSSVVYHAEKTQ